MKTLIELEDSITQLTLDLMPIKKLLEIKNDPRFDLLSIQAKISIIHKIAELKNL